MAIINLRRYYPHYPKDKFMDVPDEVAAALEEGLGPNTTRKASGLTTMSIPSTAPLLLRITRCSWCCPRRNC